MSEEAEFALYQEHREDFKAFQQYRHEFQVFMEERRKQTRGEDPVMISHDSGKMLHPEEEETFLRIRKQWERDEGVMLHHGKERLHTNVGEALKEKEALKRNLEQALSGLLPTSWEPRQKERFVSFCYNISEHGKEYLGVLVYLKQQDRADSQVLCCVNQSTSSTNPLEIVLLATKKTGVAKWTNHSKSEIKVRAERESMEQTSAFSSIAASSKGSTPQKRFLMLSNGLAVDNADIPVLDVDGFTVQHCNMGTSCRLKESYVPSKTLKYGGSPYESDEEVGDAKGSYSPKSPPL